MPLIEKIAWLSSPDLPEVQVISAKNNQRTWSVYHETYAICSIEGFQSEDGLPCSGASEWVYRRRVNHSPARTLSLMEPGEIHHNPRPSPPCDFSVLLIDPGLLGRIALEAGGVANPHFCGAVLDDPRLYGNFIEFHRALTQRTSLLHLQSLFVNCIGALLCSSCEKNLPSLAYPGRRRLEWARDFLVEHFEENVAIEQLAQIAGLSRFHFLRAFTREFGLPPHAFQIRLRLERIRMLLRSGFPIQAVEAGFADQSHLIRHFRRAYGVTPGQYAAMVHKGT